MVIAKKWEGMFWSGKAHTHIRFRCSKKSNMEKINKWKLLNSHYATGIAWACRAARPLPGRCERASDPPIPVALLSLCSPLFALCNDVLFWSNTWGFLTWQNSWCADCRNAVSLLAVLPELDKSHRSLRPWILALSLCSWNEKIYWKL